MNHFSIAVETDTKTGEVIAVYFQIRKGKAAKVSELENGNVFVNYNSKGEILGIEMLAPCSIAVLDKIARKDSEKTERFVTGAIPREMVMA